MKPLFHFLLFSILAINGSSARRSTKLKDYIGGHHQINNSATTKERSGRVFSLFSIVTFQQTSCTLNSDTTQSGTCLTTTECESKGGSKDGNCASGFGVCCSFVVKTCPGTVSQNCTYVQNPEYPAVTTESSCSITFNRVCDNLCQIRLDFETLTTAQPPGVLTDNVGLCGSTNTDTVTATSPTGYNPPVICGTLTGQHMFFETGTSGTAGELALAFGSTSASRTWQMKVTYYTCDSLNKAPTDCMQYYTGRTGTIENYNYPNQMLANQKYSSCIRQEQGYCNVVYQQGSGTTPDTFQLIGATADTLDAMAEMTACVMTFVQIPNVEASTLLDATGATSMGSNRFCGGILSQVEVDTVPGQVIASGTPFRITTFSESALGDSTIPTGTFTGYSINFSQRPCGAGRR